MNCPKCSGELTPKNYEGVELDICNKCQGYWLDDGELFKVIETKEEVFSQDFVTETLNLAYKGVPTDEVRSIEECPKCHKQMKAINYDYSSGIIIDRCPDNHGVWLDHKEIEKVQAHREEWEKRAQVHSEDWALLAKSVLEKNQEENQEKLMSSERPTRYIINQIIRKVFGL